MSRVSYSVEINRPVEQVFRYMNDPNNLTKWLGGLVEITPLTNGEARVGSKTRQVFEENGRKIEMIEEVVIYEPNRRVKIKGASKMFDLTADYQLHDLGGRTRIDYETEVQMNGLLFKLLDMLMAGSGRKKLAEDFARLKAQVEAISSRIVVDF
jgi:carbon monoxide dehydrogenase subunit G